MNMNLERKSKNRSKNRYTLSSYSMSKHSLYEESRKGRICLYYKATIENRHSVLDMYRSSSNINTFKVHAFANEFDNIYEVYDMYDWAPSILSLTNMRLARDNFVLSNILVFVKI